MRIARHIGTTPQRHGSTPCPNMFELTDGRFAIIGEVIETIGIDDIENLSASERDSLQGQRIVIVERGTLMHAKHDIPDSDLSF